METMKADVYWLEVVMATLLSIIAIVDSTSNGTMDILMPGITTQKEDEYWCTSMRAPEDVSYIISFEALPDGDRAHHMIVFACSEPGSYEDKWPCHSGCKGRSSILFAWAFHAEPTHLPKDVGFKIGGPNLRFITLQVHYRVIVKEKDHTGIRITITDNRPKFTAGVFVMAAPSTEFIPPHEEKHHMDMSCQFKGDTPIFPFAFRVHSHDLGRVITGYQYNNSWHLLGKGNPQWPQTFFPIKENYVIRSGDILVSRCTYNSMDRTKIVRIGMTHRDEMCNFYIMYYTKQDVGETYYSCVGNAYPRLVAVIPDGSDVTLPPNPLLEDVAHGKLKGNLHQMSDHHTSLLKHDGSNPQYGHLVSRRNLLHKNDKTMMDGDANSSKSNGGFGGGVGGGASDHVGGGGARAGTEGGVVVAGGAVGIRHQRNLTMGRPGSAVVGPVRSGPAGVGGYGRHGTHMPYAYPQWYDRERYPDAYDFAYNNQEDYPDEKEHFYYDVTNQRSRNRGQSGASEQLPALNGAGRRGWQKTVGRKPGPGFLQSHRPHQSHDEDDAANQRGGHTKTATPLHKNKISDSATQSTSPVNTKSPLMSTAKSANQPLSNHTAVSIEEVPDWPANAPKLGQIGGVATDSLGHVHIFHRGKRVWNAMTFTDNVINNKELIGEDVLLEFDASGKLIRSWGKDMFSIPHGMHIDDGDNIWVTDVGLHQVMRFPAGHHEPDLVLGKKYVPGHGPDHFCKPTDVATLSNGQFYVSDGYCNYRIVKFSKDGRLLKEWGRSSSSLAGDGFPPPGDFSIPHSVAVSERENILCVADRENRRIQCFDLEGNFLRQMHAPEITGKVFAVTFNPVTGSLYAVNGADNYKKDTKIQGFTFDAQSGKLLQTWSPASDSFQQAHDIAVSLDGKSVYVVDIGPNRIWKFSRTQNSGLHKSVKKSGHPPTIDDDDDADEDDEAGDILDESAGSDFGASLIIGGLLIIPVMVVVIITVFLRLKKSGKLYYIFGNRNRNRRLNLGTLLSRGRHRFSPLSTDDKDPELDLLNSDSEIEEYSVTENNTA